MPPIRPLPEAVVHQIAAGEVIERPASAVKELLENAIDAGATQITIEAEEGGRDLIRIVDDGCGIPRDELPLAVAPHATSKLHTADDLFRINTLGFRGEALGSIAGVSDFLLRSRPADQEIGGALKVRHGVVEEVTDCGTPPGTQIEIRNLFASIPVRRKFLKSKQTEFGHILESVQRAALAHPHLALRVIHNGKVVHENPAGLDRQAIITQFFGEQMGAALIPIESEVGDVRIHGYAVDPAVDRNNARGQYMFLNGRFIRDRSLGHALSEAYRGLLMTGRYPAAFLFFEMPADQVDVNVHPTKIEVRFQDPHRLFSQLLSSIRTKFLSMDLTARMSAPRHAAGAADSHASVKQAAAELFGNEESSANAGSRSNTLSARDDRRTQLNAEFQLAAGRASTEARGLWEPPSARSTSSASPGFAPSRSTNDDEGDHGSAVPFSQSSRPLVDEAPRPPANWDRPPHDRMDIAPSKDDVELADDEGEIPISPQTLAQAVSTPRGPAPESHREAMHCDSETMEPTAASRVPPVRVMQIHQSYLVVETDDGMLLIDQHALHERILYEEFRHRVASQKVQTQPLLVPEPVELPVHQVGLVLEQQDVLAEMGMTVDEFGERCVLLRSFPTSLRRIAPSAMLRMVADHLEETGRTPTRDQLLEELLHMAACKAAIKAGDPLSVEEMQTLVARRDLVDDAHHCPHGRPTVLRFTLKDLEKQFRRI